MEQGQDVRARLGVELVLEALLVELRFRVASEPQGGAVYKED